MKLYIARHGDALEAHQDPKRPLSELGQEKINALGQVLANNHIKCSYVYHSGKLRAEQTAEILCDHMDCHNPPKKIAGLLPEDDLDNILVMVEHLTKDTLLVGHLPYLALLASHLLTGRADTTLSIFQPGSMMALEKADTIGWFLAWHLPAEFFVHDS